MSKDVVSYLLERLPSEEIARLRERNGFSLEDIAEAVRQMEARGEPVVPESTIKAAIPEFFDDKKFLHNVMGDFLIDNYGVCKINGTVIILSVIHF